MRGCYCAQNILTVQPVSGCGRAVSALNFTVNMNKDEAIRYYGSASALARAIGVTPAAIFHWGERVPPLRQIQLERLTCGRLAADPSVFERKSA